MGAPFPSIPGFEISRLLGRGGMGAVYLARQQSLNRMVAIKVLPAHLAAANASYVLRFQQEARAAAKLKHPGLVQIYAAGEHAGCFYYIMEYVSGETAAQRALRKGRLDGEDALMIVEAVAVALEYAWAEARLVHRDIKPENIIIDEDGTVKVADLGLAKLMDRTSLAITIAPALIGTPHYCAPEQARGEGEVDCRADIYALGATLYHFVVGCPPFADTSGVLAMARSLTDFLDDPLDRRPDLDEPIAWLIEKMMARDRNDRQGNWHETLDDIEQVILGRMPLSAPLPPRASAVLRGARRTRPASALADEEDPAAAGPNRASRSFRIFLAVAAVLTGLLYLVWFRMTRETPPVPAPAPAAVAAEQKTMAPQPAPESQQPRLKWRNRVRRFRR